MPSAVVTVNHHLGPLSLFHCVDDVPPDVLSQECDKPREMCALWPEIRGTRIYKPCNDDNDITNDNDNSKGVALTMETLPCASAWGQCGGDVDFKGSTCCTQVRGETDQSCSLYGSGTSNMLILQI
jgi:hypothetical protein